MAKHAVSEADIAAYAELTHDRNPLHVDRAYAADGPFGGIVAHGFLMLGPVLADLSVASPLELRVRFRRPLRPDRFAVSVWTSDGTGFTVRDGDETLAEGTVTFGTRTASPQEEAKP